MGIFSKLGACNHRASTSKTSKMSNHRDPWMDLGGNMQETMVFTIVYKFPAHLPIQFQEISRILCMAGV